ncbi:MAG: hypothetical protein NTY68_04095 [Candidatus Micrarchaeota archaeon]|nr:hypothetical protein [Candidatus Micrarchaeota archaeon]
MQAASERRKFPCRTGDIKELKRAEKKLHCRDENEEMRAALAG